MGILDALYAQTPQGEQLRGGLLNMGAGLLAGSTGNYGQFAPAMAQGFAGFGQGMQQAQENQQRQQHLQQQQQMHGLKAQDMQNQQVQQQQAQEYLKGVSGITAESLQGAVRTGNPYLMEWAKTAAATMPKETTPRTQFDPNTGMLIDLNAGTASSVMGPGGALQPKPDLVFDPVRGVMIDRRSMQATPVTGANGQPLPMQNNLEKPMTEAQSKDLLFGSRAQEANKLISGLTPEVSLVAVAANDWRPPDWVPFGGAMTAGINKASSPETQQFNQAKRDFVNAVLRKESGAVISPEEFSNAERQYFPQPGDSPDVIAQKAANRDLAARGIMAGVPQDRRGSLNTQPAPAQSQPMAGMAAPRTAQDYQSLPSGTLFQAPDGSIRRKP